MSNIFSKEDTSVGISSATLIKIALGILGLWIIYLTLDILMLVAAAIFLAAALAPTVDKFEQKHIPRSLSMLSIYIILFGAIATIALIVLPQVASQIGAIASNFPTAYGRIVNWLTTLGLTDQATINQTVGELSRGLGSATEGAVSTLFDIFGGIFSFFVVLIMTFYLVVDKESAKRTVAALPSQYHDRVIKLYTSLSQKIGRWLRAQLILMFLVGLLTYIALSVMSVIGVYFFDLPKFEFALSLALIAGLLEFIPFLGPMLSAIPAVLLAFAISPSLAVIVAFIYWFIQMFEGNVLTPNIMKRAVGLSPIVSIVVFLIGARIAGMAGAFLAIPIATAAMVIGKDILSTTREQKKLASESETN
jgi:predicted PurR-regulated permease PerM